MVESCVPEASLWAYELASIPRERERGRRTKPLYKKMWKGTDFYLENMEYSSIFHGTA